MKGSRKWCAFALPALVWLSIFFLIPLYVLVCVAMGGVDPVLQTPVAEFNPLQWQFADFLLVLGKFGPGGDFAHVVLRTLFYVTAAVLGALLIGYPVAYYISRHARRTKGLLLACLLIPLWVSYQMRMLAWVGILSANGYANQILAWTGMSTEPVALLGHPQTVIFGLIYGYVPYLILPLLGSLDNIDHSLMEASRDLGAGPMEAFFKIVLPLSKQGVLGATVIIALPMFGDYYTTNMLSGTPQTSMLGNQIEIYFHGGPQPSTGASLTLILAGLLSLLMTYYLVQSLRPSPARAP